MPEIVQHTMTVLCVITQDVTLGANLALLHFMWMLVSGGLLPSRGAVFPALQAVGPAPAAVRRAWAALHADHWHIADLLTAWSRYVLTAQQGQATSYAGYVPKAVDTTAFWRPALQDCQTKHYHPPAGKALPAIVVGLIARIGHVKGHRVALPTEIVRPATADASETALHATLLARVKATLADDEMPVLDAGFKIKALQAAGLTRYVVRLADNFTARHNVLPPAQPNGRPAACGGLVRPLARTRKGKLIPATAPDRTESWTAAGRRSAPNTGTTWCCRMSKSVRRRRRFVSRPFMTRGIAHPGSWLHRSNCLDPSGGACIAIAGRSNSCLWPANR